MDGVGEYYAKWKMPSPNNQRPNVFSESGWWYVKGMGGVGEQEKMGGSLDGVDENGVGKGVGRKGSRLRQILLPHVHVWVHEWCESTLCTTIEMKSCTPFVYNESKCSL